MIGNSAYEMFRSQERAVDFLHSEDNLVYTKWFKTFAIWPTKTITGDKVWFRSIYYRWKTMKYDIPQFPKEHFNKREYATLEQILDRRLRGFR